MAKQITCITKPEAHSSHEAITNVGGSGFYITRQQCADEVDLTPGAYFVQVGNDKVNVTTFKKNGIKYIKTRPDHTQKDNLLSLDQCKR